MNHKTKIAILIAILLWASAFVGIRAGLQHYSPAGLALLRYLIASLCMSFIYFRMPAQSIMRMRDKLCLLLIGVLGIGIYNLTLNYGELAISSGMASFIISQSPILTAIFAILFLKEGVNLVQIIGFGVSMIGIGLIAFGEKGSFNWDVSLLYILIATIAGSLFNIFQKPFLKKYHAIQATTYIIWGGTLFLLFYLPQMCHDVINAPWKSTATVIYLGIFPACVGYLAWSYVLTDISASRASSFLYFMPFLATFLGWIYLHEIPVIWSILGGLCAIMGVYVVNHSYRLKMTG